MVAYLAVGADRRLDAGRGGAGGGPKRRGGVFVLPFVLLKAVHDRTGNHGLIISVQRKS